MTQRIDDLTLAAFSAEKVLENARPLKFANSLRNQVGRITGSEQRAERAFGFSLIFSGVRCILQYAILPFVLPVIGVTSEAAVPISLAINLVAITLIIYSLRRFWKIGYRYRWQYLGIAVVALVLLVAFIALDLQIISN